MHKEKVLVTSIDVDNHLNLKVSSIFKFMQMVSTNHSEELHIGQKDTIDQGICWVLIRMKVEIYKYPKMNDEIIVATHPGEIDRFLFPRFYEIYDKKGNLLIAGSSIWVLVNMSTRRVVVKPFEGRTFKGETCKDDIPLPEKIELGELPKYEDRKVRYNDIDLNGHLNNVKYIEYVVDTRSKEFYDEYQIESVVVNYDKEVREGQTIALYVDGKSDFQVKGVVEEKTSFSAKVGVRKRG